MILKRNDFIKIDIPVLKLNKVNKNRRLYNFEVENKPEHEDAKLDAAFLCECSIIGRR